jgi:cytochrome c oxidase subunit 2
MPVQVAIGLAFVLMAGSLAAVFLTVALEARTEPAEVIYRRGQRIRLAWFAFLLVFAAVVFLLSLTWLPYQFVRQSELGAPSQRIQVTAEQFDFQLSATTLPLGQTVEFDVTSKDVNHGFAIYDPDGHIVGQTQAMPGFTNVLIIRFDKPGTYTLHCTELCGPFHFGMMGTFTVGGSTAGGSLSPASGFHCPLGGGAPAAGCGGGGCGSSCGGGGCAA